MTLVEKTYPSKDVSIFKQVKLEHLLAGISGGTLSTLCLHPLDVIKIRFAVNDGKIQTPKYNGIINAFGTIHQQEGFKGLYRGLVPNTVGAGLAWGCYFLFYNALKVEIQKGDADKPLSAGYHLLAASQAGVLSLLITNPIWVVKTRTFLQFKSNKNEYNGLFDALVKIYKNEGLRGYYKGFVPGIFGVSHGAVQFMVYEEIKNRYNKYYNLPITTKLANMEYLCFAAVSKFIAAATTYPYQVVRARLQTKQLHYNGTVDCMRETWKCEGWRGFYKGLGANLLRVTPATMITFVVYENVSHFLINKSSSY